MDRLKALIVQRSIPDVLGCMCLNTPPQDNVSHAPSPELVKKDDVAAVKECVLGRTNLLWFAVSKASVKQLLFQTDVISSYSTAPLKFAVV